MVNPLKPIRWRIRWRNRLAPIPVRALDLVIAGIGSIVSAPLIALLAVAIRLESPGHPIYRQTRVGRDGAPFEIYNLRTMVAGAEFTGARLACHRYVAVTGTGVLGWVAASWAPGNGSPSTTAAGATPCSSSAAARSCKPGGRPPGGQEVAASRDARRSTRPLSSATAASKLAGSPAGTGSGTDQCTAAA